MKQQEATASMPTLLFKSPSLAPSSFKRAAASLPLSLPRCSSRRRQRDAALLQLHKPVCRPPPPPPVEPSLPPRALRELLAVQCSVVERGASFPFLVYYVCLSLSLFCASLSLSSFCVRDDDDDDDAVVAVAFFPD